MIWSLAVVLIVGALIGLVAARADDVLKKGR